ncbi:endocuticle structural glycoprotein SgAbd-8-like [Leptopilina boulardi]|uniref:endocuticle structural glycoprotein SgAbd-8-like n=1 Tax=Leptopilina boulardi TaxID=63433 RepID=UPI0021F64971|nr:endocuticle structural glycoprotein SgAbd-8-like [Leptopilina boulardi]
MKFFIAALALVAAASALPQERDAAILRQAQDISPEGAYNYNYETENGIRASEDGTLQNVGPNGEAAIVAQGSFQYTAPDGTPVAVSYVADHNGYQPSGDILPVGPAIPAQIQRALDYIAAHPPQPENRK